MTNNAEEYCNVIADLFPSCFGYIDEAVFNEIKSNCKRDICVNKYAYSKSTVTNYKKLFVSFLDGEYLMNIIFY